MKNDIIPNFESIFKLELTEFINFKRSAGYEYGPKVCDLLKQLDKFFVEYNLQEKKIDLILIEKFFGKISNYTTSTKLGYFCKLRMFTEFLVSKNYPHITVPIYNPYHKVQRFIPYIYTQQEIEKIFDISKSYFTLYTALHLLYNCGLRISEVVNLKMRNIDIENQTILIEHSKNDNMRLIPLTNTIFHVIQEYIHSTYYSISDDMYVFDSSKSRITIKFNLRNTFHKIQSIVGIKERENGHLPRIHDLRHTFAVHALEQMQQRGFDLYTSLPILSIYLGHKSIVETEYYLRLIPEYSQNVLTSQDYIKDLYIKKEMFNEE